MDKAILSFIFLMTLSTMHAQGIIGTWNGKLNTPIGQLTLIWHIKDSAGVLTASMDSPDQNVGGIPASKISFENPELHIEIASLMIKYDATLEPGDSISGTFRQAMATIPLTLYKGGLPEKSLVRPQEPKPPFSYKVEDIRFVNHKEGNISFAGTLTIPAKGNKFSAVVLISGSGRQDRDETIEGHKPFLVIADYLTKRGIAVLRFDDRGTAGSGGDFSKATTADFATDAAAAIQYLKTRKEIDPGKIGLIGHSEGGIIAPMVAASDESIDFIVLLAGPGYAGREILLMQTAAIAGASGATPQQLEAIKNENSSIYDIIINGQNDSLTKQELIEKFKSLTPPAMSDADKEKLAESQAASLLSPWMVYFLKNDPADYLKKVKCPVLALDGTKDLQVPAESNINAIKQALAEGGNKRVTTRIFPGLNHLFQHASTGLPTEYGKIEETFSPEVLEFMANWIEKQVK